MSKLLNQGAFGCIYYPSLNCKGKTIKSKEKKKQLVSKIQEFNYNSKNEIAIGKVIKKVKEYKQFFLPVIDYCKLNISLVDNSLLKDCDILEDREAKQFVLMKIEFMDSIDFFAFIINEQNSKELVFNNIIDSYKYLLIAIKKLKDKSIVHFDIKNENILFNSENKNPYLIDFGISLNMKKLNEKNIDDYFYVFTPDYYIWAPEIHIICYLVKVRLDPLAKIKREELEYIAEMSVKTNKGLNIFSPEFKAKFLKKTKKYVLQFAGMTKEKVLEKLLIPDCFETWDNYALSILYLRCFEYIFYYGFSDVPFLIDLSQLFLQNISPDPSERLTIEQTRLQLDQMLASQEIHHNLKGIIKTISIDKTRIIDDNLTRYV
jgi:serine/threonine protein kinase